MTKYTVAMRIIRNGRTTSSSVRSVEGRIAADKVVAEYRNEGEDRVGVFKSPNWTERALGTGLHNLHELAENGATVQVIVSPAESALSLTGFPV